MISPVIFGGVRIVDRPDPCNVHRLDRLAMPIVQDMMANGMKVSRDYLGKLSVRLQAEMDQIAANIYGIAGRKFNIGSPDQLRVVLFDELKIKQAGKIKLTSTGKESTDADVLEQIRFKHDIVPPILEWRRRSKLKGTYADTLPFMLDTNNRLHTTILSTRTDTGRYASKDPNLQNIPTRTELGKEIRKAFIPSVKGDWIGNYRVRENHVIGSIDLSQIEMRMHGHDSKCKRMIQVYDIGDDLYWATSEVMFDRHFTKDERKNGKIGNLTYKEVFRFPAKTTTLGVSYDISPAGLLDQMIISICEAYALQPEVAKAMIDEWDEGRCASMITKWFGAYPEILERRLEHHRRARRYGFVWDLWGRIRYIPQVRSFHKGVINEGLRAAGNMPIQAGAGGVLKLGMGKTWQYLAAKWRKYGIIPLMTIHDELLFEGPRKPLEDFLGLLREMFQTLVVLDCKIDAGWDVSELSWGDIAK